MNNVVSIQRAATTNLQAFQQNQSDYANSPSAHHETKLNDQIGLQRRLHNLEQRPIQIAHVAKTVTATPKRHRIDFIKSVSENQSQPHGLKSQGPAQTCAFPVSNSPSRTQRSIQHKAPSVSAFQQQFEINRSTADFLKKNQNVSSNDALISEPSAHAQNWQARNITQGSMLRNRTQLPGERKKMNAILPKVLAARNYFDVDARPNFASQTSQPSQEKLKSGNSMQIEELELRSASPLLRSTLPKVLNQKLRSRMQYTDDTQTSGTRDLSLDRETLRTDDDEVAEDQIDMQSENAQPDDTPVHFTRTGQVNNRQSQHRKIKQSSTIKISKYLKKQRKQAKLNAQRLSGTNTSFGSDFKPSLMFNAQPQYQMSQQQNRINTTGIKSQKTWAADEFAKILRQQHQKLANKLPSPIPEAKKNDLPPHLLKVQEKQRVTGTSVASRTKPIEPKITPPHDFLRQMQRRTSLTREAPSPWSALPVTPDSINNDIIFSQTDLQKNLSYDNRNDEVEGMNKLGQQNVRKETVMSSVGRDNSNQSSGLSFSPQIRKGRLMTKQQNRDDTDRTYSVEATTPLSQRKEVKFADQSSPSPTKWKLPVDPPAGSVQEYQSAHQNKKRFVTGNGGNGFVQNEFKSMRHQLRNKTQNTGSANHSSHFESLISGRKDTKAWQREQTKRIMVYKGATANAVAAAMVTQGRDSPNILLKSTPQKSRSRRSTLRNYNYTQKLPGVANNDAIKLEKTKTMPFRSSGMNLTSLTFSKQ